MIAKKAGWFRSSCCTPFVCATSQSRRECGWVLQLFCHWVDLKPEEITSYLDIDGHREGQYHPAWWLTRTVRLLSPLLPGQTGPASAYPLFFSSRSRLWSPKWRLSSQETRRWRRISGLPSHRNHFSLQKNDFVNNPVSLSPGPRKVHSPNLFNVCAR